MYSCMFVGVGVWSTWLLLVWVDCMRGVEGVLVEFVEMDGDFLYIVIVVVVLWWVRMEGVIYAFEICGLLCCLCPRMRHVIRFRKIASFRHDVCRFRLIRDASSSTMSWSLKRLLNGIVLASII